MVPPHPLACHAHAATAARRLALRAAPQSLMRQMRQTISTSYVVVVGGRPAAGQHHGLGMQGLVRARLQPDARHVAVYRQRPRAPRRSRRRARRAAGGGGGAGGRWTAATAGLAALEDVDDDLAEPARLVGSRAAPPHQMTIRASSRTVTSGTSR